jgi:hypothetical protein
LLLGVGEGLDKVPQKEGGGLQLGPWIFLNRNKTKQLGMHGKRLREIDSASKAGSTCVPCCKAWHMGKITGAAFTGYKCYKVRQESCEIFLGSVITLVLGTWYILLISAARVP